jgi:hypothetical protein
VYHLVGYPEKLYFWPRQAGRFYFRDPIINKAKSANHGSVVIGRVASLQPRGHHDHLVLYTFLPLLPTTCHCCYGTVLFDNFTRNTMIHGVFASSSISRENASAKGGPIRRPHRLIAFAAIGWILTPMKCIPGDVLNPSDCFNKPLPIYWILMSQSIIEFRWRCSSKMLLQPMSPINY